MFPALSPLKTSLDCQPDNLLFAKHARRSIFSKNDFISSTSARVQIGVIDVSPVAFWLWATNIPA